jgi:hypothetical protein
MQGPLFEDGSFEFVPIPDNSGVGLRTYGNTKGVWGTAFSEYFPVSRRSIMVGQAMHVDPEFETFTYGDPTAPKAGLRNLRPGDLLVFYAGLEGWGHARPPALYLIGYFVVAWAGVAAQHPEEHIRRHCGKNFHVMHETLYRRQRDKLVLVKGGLGSRLLTRAHCISTMACDRLGKPLKVLSPASAGSVQQF